MEHLKSSAKSKPTKVVKHFRLGDISKVFSAEYLDGDACRYIVHALLYDGLPEQCPSCGIRLRGKKAGSFWRGKRVRCGSCGKFFTALTGTFLAGTHMNYREIVLLALFLSLDLPFKKIGQLLEISQETVRLWKMKFDAFENMKKNEAGL